MARFYPSHVILSGLSPGREHAEEILKQLVALAYFGDVVTRAAPVNETTLGAIESSGLVYLRPVGNNEKFVVEIPRVFYFYFSQQLENLWDGLFPFTFVPGALGLTEDSFPQFIAAQSHLHHLQLDAMPQW